MSCDQKPAPTFQPRRTKLLKRFRTSVRMLILDLMRRSSATDYRAIGEARRKGREQRAAELASERAKPVSHAGMPETMATARLRIEVRNAARKARKIAKREAIETPANPGFVIDWFSLGWAKALAKKILFLRFTSVDPDARLTIGGSGTKEWEDALAVSPTSSKLITLEPTKRYHGPSDRPMAMYRGTAYPVD